MQRVEECLKNQTEWLGVPNEPPCHKIYHQKSFWDFELWNLSLEGREEEDEEPWQDIGFFEGMNFLDAIARS